MPGLASWARNAYYAHIKIMTAEFARGCHESGHKQAKLCNEVLRLTFC